MNRNFSVTLSNESKSFSRTLAVTADEYILDIADEEGMELPYSCRAGACFDCLGKVTEGNIQQSDKALEFLKPSEIKAGYVLLCATCPRSDCKILTHQAEEFFGK